MALFGLACLVLSPFAFYQIITKAGFSGWWTFVPYTPWIVGFLGQVAFRMVDTNRSIGSVFDQLTLWFVVTILSGMFVAIMFFVFAFSKWPCLQPARAPQAPWPGPRTDGPATSGPPGSPPGDAGLFEDAPAPVASAGPFPGVPPAPMQTQRTRPMGWQRVDESADEQYWDGRTWTARRRPSGDGGYIIIPLSD